MAIFFNRGPEPDAIRVRIYYRGHNRKLRCIGAEMPIQDDMKAAVEDIRQAVVQDLADTKESYLKPVLVLIHGSKA